MTLSVDLNADLGESFGPWPMGSDEALRACGLSAPKIRYLRAMAGEMLYLANIGIDFFRMDAVAFIWKLAFNDGRVISDHLGRLGDVAGRGAELTQRRRREGPHVPVPRVGLVLVGHRDDHPAARLQARALGSEQGLGAGDAGHEDQGGVGHARSSCPAFD
mgnify:CR=1 FL=1